MVHSPTAPMLTFPLRLLLSSAIFAAALVPASARAGKHRQTQLVVVLDPGHGGPNKYGNESGAVDPTGTLLEKNLTLQVAKAAARDLTAMGYRVFLTRTS